MENRLIELLEYYKDRHLAYECILNGASNPRAIALRDAARLVISQLEDILNQSNPELLSTQLK